MTPSVENAGTPVSSASTDEVALAGPAKPLWCLGGRKTKDLRFGPFRSISAGSKYALLVWSGRLILVMSNRPILEGLICYFSLSLSLSICVCVYVCVCAWPPLSPFL